MAARRLRPRHDAGSRRATPEGIVGRLATETIRGGADRLEVEYKDGYEEVIAMKSHSHASRLRPTPMPARRRDVGHRMMAYELKVTLQGVRPPVWRRVRVRSDMTLEDLHRVLQVVMGWSDSHMHAFRPGIGRRGLGRVSAPTVERDQEHRTRLDEVLRRPLDRMVYEYDFGDRWEHDVLLEKVVDHPAEARYPWVLAGARACPPEDVGGVGGYARFLQVMRDPGHPEHEELVEWQGGSFDPTVFDAQALNGAFHGRWAPSLDG